MKILLRVVAIIAALIVLLVIAVQLLNPPLPDSAEMQAYFAERRDAFERRHAEVSAALAANKSVITGTNDAVGYEFLMRSHSPREGVIFITHKRGIGVGMSGTGVAYLNSPPEKTYPDLKAMYPDAKAVEGFVGFSHIQGNWYYLLWEAD